MQKKSKKKKNQNKKVSVAKKVEKPAPFISHFHGLKKSWASLRTVFFWSLAVVAFFTVLSLVASYADTKVSRSGRFEQKLTQVASLSLEQEEDTVSVIATGDIMTARHVETKMRALNDYTYPFQRIADFLKSGDITFGNLETPLYPGKTVPKGSMTFRADAKGAEGLLYAGYDIVSLANNHTMNYQVPGLTTTLQELKKAGILYAGAGKNMDGAHTPALAEVKGKKVAFYAYNDQSIPPRRHGEATINTPGIAKMDVEAVKNDVKNALTYADFVIVSMHAGKEYVREPTQFQKGFAHAAIDAGASAVFGHHPHWVQSVEYYGNGVIFYSLGNFVFDQFFSEDVQTGLVCRLSLKTGEKPGVEIFPVKLEKMQPVVLEGDARAIVMQKLGL